MNISLHIERLILDGITVGSNQGTLIQAAVEMELKRLLAADMVSSTLRTAPMVASTPAASIQLRADGDPIRLGHQVANAVMGSLGNHTHMEASIGGSHEQ
jgi:hypothetical protein